MESPKNFTLITGASGGIGFDLAVLMASKGHNLILTARSEEKIANLARQLSKTHGIEAVAFPADLSVADDREKLP
ncbi:MAG TPA: SDR family NAD(P)-dependent oxidoreductase, partial [Lentimicrobium sp.]|nr:SDR family NAD(P)-dependent oxidoreductase [Lentimicrobium sp.]